MYVVTMLNQKGGVGKTSTCHHLAGALAKREKRVLLIDNDPQASLTKGLIGPERTARLDPSETLAAIYRDAGVVIAETVIRSAGVPGIDIVYGHRAVKPYNVPEPLESSYETQRSIAAFLAMAEGYDVVLIDCPPNLHLCSFAALAASSRIIVPVQAEDYGAQGIPEVQDSIDLVRATANPALEVLGYLLAMFAPRRTLHQLYAENLRTLYGDAVFQTTIPAAADISEAISSRKMLAQYKPRCAAAKAYDALAVEIEERLTTMAHNDREVA